jgi:hypothetical protein
MSLPFGLIARALPFFPFFGSLSIRVHAQSLTTLHQFQSKNGMWVFMSPLVLGPDGALYGRADTGDDYLVRNSPSPSFRFSNELGLERLGTDIAPAFKGPGGFLYGTDYRENTRIVRFNPDQTVPTAVANLRLWSPYTLMTADSEAFYWVNYASEYPYQWGVYSYRSDGEPTQIHEFPKGIVPTALAIGTDGFLYGVSRGGISGTERVLMGCSFACRSRVNSQSWPRFRELTELQKTIFSKSKADGSMEPRVAASSDADLFDAIDPEKTISRFCITSME